MITLVDWWCDMCEQVGFVSASTDVQETQARVRKSHRETSPKCECVAPYYRARQFVPEETSKDARA